MDIWIIINGKASGPMPDFTVRAKIAAGEFDAHTPAWHEGRSSWTPLAEIPLFAREFAADETPPTSGSADSSAEHPTGPADSQADGASPPIAARASAIRRFWARWFDLYLYAALWWFSMWAMGNDIRALLSNMPVMLMLYLPWFGLEILMLHYFGTTAGKWLLGIRVANPDGSLLSLGQSARRAIRVCFLGVGMGWEVVSLICQAISYVQARRSGTTLWDSAGNHVVSVTPLRPLRVTTYALVLFAALQLQTAVLEPYLREALIQRFPELRKTLENSPHWQLPPRHQLPVQESATQDALPSFL